MYGVDKKDLEHIWKHLDGCFNELNQAKLFITGGTGFFGAWLLESLHFAQNELGLQIKIDVLTRNVQRIKNKYPHFFISKSIDFHEGDIRNFSFPSQSYTHLIHAATDASAQLNEENPLEMYETIFQGTKHVLDFAQKANIQKMLFVSSGAVYGQQPESIANLSETDMGFIKPLSVSSAYGLGKLTAEHMCGVYARKYNFDLKIARCFAFVGPYLPLDTHFAIGNFIKNVIQQEDIYIKGDGTSLRSYLYSADLVIWLLRILCDGNPMEIYNVGSEDSVSISRLAEYVNAQYGGLSKVIIRDSQIEGRPEAKYVPSTQKAQTELALSQYTRLEDAIRKTILWNLNR